MKSLLVSALAFVVIFCTGVYFINKNMPIDAAEITKPYVAGVAVFIPPSAKIVDKMQAGTEVDMSRYKKISMAAGSQNTLKHYYQKGS